jgi:hypothetical protein
MSDIKSNQNDIKAPKRGKTNGYNSAHIHAKRNRKRQEADARQQEHDSLTINEKIEKAQSHRGKSKRELTRLLKLAEEAGVVVPPPVTPKATKKVVKKKAAVK